MAWSELTDAELVERTRAGEQEAYGTLVTRYQGHAYGLAYSLVNNWADAQDIAQETFIRSYLNLDQLRNPDRFAAWLRRVTFSVTMNWLKAYRPRLFEQLEGRVDLEALEIPDFRPGPAEQVERQELAEAVHRAVASLPPRYRVPLTMFHLDGLSYQKVADFLDIPLGTAKSLISRARGKLKIALTTSYGEELAPVVQEAFDEHKLTPEFAAEAVGSIKGVPKLRWGEWKDCSYCGAVTVLVNTIGVPVTYEEVMGMSGACYRICMKDDWCPSSGMPQCGYDVETPLYKALGFEVYGIDDEKQRRQKVVECIDKGLPVLCCDQRDEPEWGLITGYAKGGEIFFGRTYFDYHRPRKDEVFTEDRYYVADKYPGYSVVFFDRRCQAISSKDALRQSLETCLGTLNQGPGRHGYVRGYEAYELWIRGLEDEEKFAEFPAGTNAYHIDMLRDARRCAHLYLEQHLDLVGQENRMRLTRAAGIFKAMFEKLMDLTPYQGTETSFNGKTEDWGMGKRRAHANLLRELCAMERQVEVEFRAMLDEWDS
jgi:RNA polymerase sigma factor (sigma-70 family)